MITKVLLFNTEHEAAEALKKLQNSGIPASSLSVLVSNVEHSRLLNAETDIHIDLFSEITSENRRDVGRGAADESSHHEGDLSGLAVPIYAQQPSMQVPFLGFTGIKNGFEQHEQGIPSLLSYGISKENAERCLHALRAGQCIVCISESSSSQEAYDNASLYSGLALGGLVEESSLPDVGAAEVLDNT